MKLETTWRTAAAAALMLGAAACSKSGQLSVSAKAETAADAGTTGGTLDLGNGILVSDVKLVVRRITLHGLENEDESTADGGADDHGTDSLTASRSAADQGSGQDDGAVEQEAEEDEVKIGPFLVDLKGDALASKTLTNVFDASSIPAGTFREIKIIVAPDATVAADGSSVTIDGTIDGKDFAFTSSLHAAQKIESQVTIGSGSTQNVTLAIDPSGWFVDSAGNRLDPSDEANRPQIEDNIRRSIKGFCDHDRDGQDDANEHHGDGGSHDG
jgi:hypothetical protein